MKSWFDYPKSLTTTGIVIAQTTVLLYIGAFMMLGVEVAQQQIWILTAITLLPMLFFAYLSKFELKTIERKRRAQSGTLIGAYMLFKGIRLLVTIAAIAIYIYVCAPLRMVFIINMLVLFLIALTMTSICHLRAERKQKTDNEIL